MTSRRDDLEHWEFHDPQTMLDRKRARDKKQQKNPAIKLALEKARQEWDKMFPEEKKK